MKSALSKSGYRLDLQTSVWLRPGYTGIAYSDGDDFEQRIAAVIKQACDITVLSAELRQHSTDWPSLYHLSGTRSNILRPFQDILKGADVLEVGAGCGAITRYLGESGANVLALEGTLRRAAIARSRTRDLANVIVAADRFDAFECDHKFDAVTLIGVLEYANLFTSGENPALSMLRRVKAALKPDGRLILAIENQLGLKYFAGVPEDHLGQPMYGVEGRYVKDQPQTYGRKALIEILRESGFAYSEFMAPFPDYKLPVSIVTESGFSCEKFDAAALAWQSVKRDPQLPPILAMSLELVWPVVVHNGFALDLANSFLVAAGGPIGQRLDSSVLAWHFTNERSREFCKQTRFLQTDHGAIEVHYHLLDSCGARRVESRLLTFSIPEKAEYVQGRPLAQELLHIVTRDGWRMEEVGSFLKRYLCMIGSMEASGDVPRSIDSADSLLPGLYFDLILQNIIVGRDGLCEAIDKEWQLNADMSVGWLMFRSLRLLIYTVTRFGVPADDFENTPMGFIHAAFKAAGFAVTPGEIENYAKSEEELQAEVTRRPLKTDEFINWLRTASLPRHNLNRALVERDEQIAGFDQVVAGRDVEIVNLKQFLSDRDVHIRNLDAHVARLTQARIDCEQQIAGILNSISWRATKPLRRLRKIKGTIFWILSQTVIDFFRRPFICPFKQLREYFVIRNHSLFDKNYYLKRNSDVAQYGIDPAWHYIKSGAGEGRNPSAGFNTSFYLTSYPDVAAFGSNPLYHFIKEGKSEGRFPSKEALLKNSLDAKNAETPDLGMDQRAAMPADPLALAPEGVWPSDVRVLEIPCNPDHGVDLLPEEKEKIGAVGVFLHIFFEDLTEELIQCALCVPDPRRIYISTDTQLKAMHIRKILELHGFEEAVEIRVLPNRGWDIAPFIVGFADRIREHSILLRLHSKRSPQISGDVGSRWRRMMFNTLAGSPERVRGIIHAFAHNPELGMACSSHAAFWKECVHFGGNFIRMEQLLSRFGVAVRPDLPIDFPMGSMFWCRSRVLDPWLEMQLRFEDFEPTLPSMRDQTLAHAMERLFFFGCGITGHRWARLPPPK